MLYSLVGMRIEAEGEFYLSCFRQGGGGGVTLEGRPFPALYVSV